MKDELIALHTKLGDLEDFLSRKGEDHFEDVEQVRNVEVIIERLVKEMP